MTRVLILDDDPLWREVLGRALRDAGCSTATTDDPETVLRHADKFDLVVIDLAMPATDGLTVLERLKSANPSVRAIVATAYPYAPMVNEASTLGADAVFTKDPVEAVVGFATSIPVH